jgi:hypothetical protein
MRPWRSAIPLRTRAKQRVDGVLIEVRFSSVMPVGYEEWRSVGQPSFLNLVKIRRDEARLFSLTVCIYLVSSVAIWLL